MEANYMRCKLCLKERKLCKSHIIPEFLYQPLYHPKNHKYTELSTDPSKRNIPRRKGIYERLLCEECEEKINRYETHASTVWSRMKKEKFAQKITVIDNVDYDKFKIFQLSLIWRAGVSSRQEFSNVSLGKHCEILRKMIYNQNPGKSHEYGCMLIITPSLYSILIQMVMPPTMQKVDAHRCYRFILAGMFWIFFVSSHMSQNPLKETFLSEKGYLSILCDEDYPVRFVQQFARELKAAGKLKSSHGA